MSVPSFIQALRYMLSNPESPVEWDGHGQHVRVTERFEPCVHMTCTVSRKYGTFMRQLNNHGFRSRETNVWSHPLFAQNTPHRDHLITPVRRRERAGACTADANVGGA